MPKHTPGPWEWIRVAKDQPTINKSQRIKGQGITIAETWDIPIPDGVKAYDIECANARLISASPIGYDLAQAILDQARDGYENAQECHRKHPDTFWVPSQEELSGIHQGSCVKVCAASERFWVVVTGVDGDTITGTINNDLIQAEHGLKCGDTISFKAESVYDIYPE